MAVLHVEKDDQVITKLGRPKRKASGKHFCSKHCFLKILVSFRGKIFVLFCWLGLVFITPVFTIFVQFLSFTKKTGNGITL
jgi:hypothetical protein